MRDLYDLDSVLVGADVLLVCTGAAHPVVGADLLAEATRRRRESHEGPLVVVDLAVPRNVDPTARDLPDLELLDMDDLRSVAERTMQGRRREMEHARVIVEEGVDRYRTEIRAREAAPVVAALRDHIEALCRSELDRRRSRFGDLDPETWAEVEATTRAVLAKVLHRPTVVVKGAAGTPRGERLVEALRALFDL